LKKVLKVSLTGTAKELPFFKVFDPPLPRLRVIFASIHRSRTLKNAFPYHDLAAKMAAGVVLVQEGGSLETLVAEVAPEITKS
jgi:hypothetical protein